MYQANKSACIAAFMLTGVLDSKHKSKAWVQQWLRGMHATNHVRTHICWQKHTKQGCPGTTRDTQATANGL